MKIASTSGRTGEYQYLLGKVSTMKIASTSGRTGEYQYLLGKVSTLARQEKGSTIQRINIY